jgi:hypothetical protein
VLKGTERLGWQRDQAHPGTRRARPRGVSSRRSDSA